MAENFPPPARVISRKSDEIQKWIKRRLGEPTVDVELDAENLKDAVEGAILWWGGVVGQEKGCVININPSGGEFDVPDDCQEVVKVVFESQTGDTILNVFDWAGVELAPVGYGSYFSTPSGAYSYIEQWQSYLEQGRKIVSVDPDWEFRRDIRKLLIYPVDRSSGSSGFSGLGNHVFVSYLIEEINLERLHSYEFDLVRRYALCEAMETLGNMRTKWTSVPSAQGEASLNGDTLLSNAETLRADLDEKAQAYRRPDEFFAF